MHVGLNALFLTPGEQGGMETYVRELITRLAQHGPDCRFTAFVNLDAAATDGPWHGLDGLVTVPIHARRRAEWVRGEQQLLPRLAARAGIDILHSLGSTAPGWGRFRRVVTIHDLIYRTVPEAHPGLRSLGMSMLVPLAARRSHRVIVDSQATQRDLLRYTSTRPDRVDVIPLGGSGAPRAVPLPEAQLRQGLDAGDRPILLSVSAKLPHKNLMRLLGALASLETAERPVLVLPGYPTEHERELRQRASTLGVAEDVRFLGWVSSEELEGLYAAAVGVVLPSLIEGFGLPVLEAMARGVPVACSDRGALAEVAGDCALLFDPESEAEITAAIRRLLGEPELRARLSAAGPKRAAGFRWETTAERTVASYRAAVSAGSR